MKQSAVEFLRCPLTRSPLRLESATFANGEIETGELVATSGDARYPIVRSVPRFVDQNNYAVNFGIQWNYFRRTQLDSYTGLPISRDQFRSWTGWSLEELRGKRVLDVGCGAGRFTEIALSAGAEVVALDYSSAVDACWQNHAFHRSVHVIQGDIYQLPFEVETFDYIYCIGVLQHTPDVHRAFLSLPPYLRQGGKLSAALYPKIWQNLFWYKYWLRPFTQHIAPDRMFRIVQRAVPVLLPVSRVLSHVPKLGRHLRHLVPVANHELDWPLTPQQVQDWAILNTFDMFAPAHDSPQSGATLQAWLRESKLVDTLVERRGFMVARGTRPLQSTL